MFNKSIITLNLVIFLFTQNILLKAEPSWFSTFRRHEVKIPEIQKNKSKMLYYDTIKIKHNLPDNVIVSSKCKENKLFFSFPNGVLEKQYNDNWKYVLINMETLDTVQYSFNFSPKPKKGMAGKRKKDGYGKNHEGDVNVLKPLSPGKYLLLRYFENIKKDNVLVSQTIIIRDNIPPTPILVDIATIVMENGKCEIKARWFDKGGCGNGCISSFDNCTESKNLIFTFTDMLPDTIYDKSIWKEQLQLFGKIYFNPIDGKIMTEVDFNKGMAHAWDPEKKTTSRVFLSEKINKEIPGYKIKVYVWDEFSVDENYKHKDYNFEEIEILFKF